MSVMFDSTIIDNNEYMLTNDLGIIDDLRASYIPGTLAKGLAGAHFGEKDQTTPKNIAIE